MDREKIVKSLRDKIEILADHIRGHAVEAVEWEYIELEHIFSLLVLGAFVGLPAPPMQITLDLLPLMEKNLHLMIEKTDTASGPISELTSILNVS